MLGDLFVRADVMHFSQWGYGWPVRRSCMTGELVEADGDSLDPVEGVTITARLVATGDVTGHVVTDSDGQFCVPVRGGSAESGMETMVDLHANLEDEQVFLGTFESEPLEEPATCSTGSCLDIGSVVLERREADAPIEACTLVVRLDLVDLEEIDEWILPETLAGTEVRAMGLSASNSELKELCTDADGEPIENCLVSRSVEDGLAHIVVPRGEEQVRLTGNLIHEIEPYHEEESPLRYEYSGSLVLDELVCVEDLDEPNGEQEIDPPVLPLGLRKGDIEAYVYVWRDGNDGDEEILIEWYTYIPHYAVGEEQEVPASRIAIYSGEDENDEVLFEIVAREDVEGEPGIHMPAVVSDYDSGHTSIRQLVTPDMDAINDPDAYPDAYVVVSFRLEMVGILWTGRGEDLLHMPQ